MGSVFSSRKVPVSPSVQPAPVYRRRDIPLALVKALCTGLIAATTQYACALIGANLLFFIVIPGLILEDAIEDLMSWYRQKEAQIRHGYDEFCQEWREIRQQFRDEHRAAYAEHSFMSFTRLPPELRFDIWERAMAAPMVLDFFHLQPWRSRWHDPAADAWRVANTCAESRLLWTRLTRLRPVVHEFAAMRHRAPVEPVALDCGPTVLYVRDMHDMSLIAALLYSLRDPEVGAAWAAQMSLWLPLYDLRTKKPLALLERVIRNISFAVCRESVEAGNHIIDVINDLVRRYPAVETVIILYGVEARTKRKGAQQEITWYRNHDDDMAVYELKRRGHAGFARQEGDSEIPLWAATRNWTARLSAEARVKIVFAEWIPTPKSVVDQWKNAGLFGENHGRSRFH